MLWLRLHRRMDEKDDGIKVHVKKGRVYDKGFPQ